jgi:hypothetical protein
MAVEVDVERLVTELSAVDRPVERDVTWLEFDVTPLFVVDKPVDSDPRLEFAVKRPVERLATPDATAETPV